MLGGGLGNLAEKADSLIDDALESVGLGLKPKPSPYMRAAKEAAHKFMRKPWKQGWQWSITTNDPNQPEDLDMYVKDIDYGDGSIDVEVERIGSGSIAVPSFSSAGEITMTVREDDDETISKWVKSRIAKVKNPDSTVNLPIDYVFTLNINTLDKDGNVKSTTPHKGYFIKAGNKAHSREGGNTNESFPVIFQKFTTLDFGN